MNGLRFKIGETCIIAVVTNYEDSHLVGTAGVVVDVLPDTPDRDGGFRDYSVDYGDDEWVYDADDWQLRKPDAPAEESAMTSRTELEASA